MAPLPKEQAQQLVDYFGGKRAAARAVGVSWGTFWHWINPEYDKNRGINGKRWDQQPENCIKVNIYRTLCDSKRQVKKSEERLKELCKDGS